MGIIKIARIWIAYFTIFEMNVMNNEKYSGLQLS